MARRRFFVSEIRRGSAELTGADAEHLVRVLRVETGQSFEISDNNRVYLAEVQAARKSLVLFTVTEELPLSAPSVTVELFCSLFKFDRFEVLVEKATELGVSAIQPIEATRSERGLAEASVKRHSRWQRIALEASQQSRRAHLPEIRQTIEFQAAIQSVEGIKLFLDEQARANSIVEQLPAKRSADQTVTLLLGPEGGWTDEERASALEAGWLGCSLGEIILRAETAGLAALAVVRALWAAGSP